MMMFLPNMACLFDKPNKIKRLKREKVPNSKFVHLMLHDNYYSIPDKIAPSSQFNIIAMRLDRRNLLGYD